MLSVVLIAGACATVRESRINPLNWFGSSTSEPAATQTAEASPQEANPLIPRERPRIRLGRRNQERELEDGTLIANVSELVVERVPGGAIIRVEGIADRQGVHSVRLTPADPELRPEDGVLTFRLEGVTPDRARSGGPDRARRVVAAVSLTDQQLGGVRVIRIEGAQNVRTTRRN